MYRDPTALPISRSMVHGERTVIGPLNKGHGTVTDFLFWFTAFRSFAAGRRCFWRCLHLYREFSKDIFLDFSLGTLLEGYNGGERVRGRREGGVVGMRMGSGGGMKGGRSRRGCGVVSRVGKGRRRGMRCVDGE